MTTTPSPPAHDDVEKLIEALTDFIDSMWTSNVIDKHYADKLIGHVSSLQQQNKELLENSESQKQTQDALLKKCKEYRKAMEEAYPLVAGLASRYSDGGHTEIPYEITDWIKKYKSLPNMT